MTDNKELTRKLVIQKVLGYANSPEGKMKLRNENIYAKKFLGYSTLEFLNDGDVKDINVLYKRLRISMGVLRRNSSDMIKYEELDISLYGYYISQCMSYVGSPDFVMKMMAKIVNMTLNQILKIEDEYYHVDNLNNNIIQDMLVGDKDSEEKFMTCMTGAKKDKKREGINNLGDSDKHWYELEGAVKRIDGTPINSLQDLTSSKNEDIKFMFDELITNSGSRYKTQKTIVRNMVKPEVKKIISPIMRRHMYMICIKSIVFYKTEFESNTVVNYDFYWSHKDKFDLLINMDEKGYESEVNIVEAKLDTIEGVLAKDEVKSDVITADITNDTNIDLKQVDENPGF